MRRRKRPSVRTSDDVTIDEISANKQLIEKAQKWSKFELIITRVRRNLWYVGTIEDYPDRAQGKKLSDALFVYIETKRLVKFAQELDA